MSTTNVRPACAASQSHTAFSLSVAEYFTPTIFPNLFFFFLASLEFVTLFGLIKKLVEKKMENKLRR